MDDQDEKDDFTGELKLPLNVQHRRKVISHDNNVDVILAGRTKKTSIELPVVDKLINKRIQKILIESENNFRHLIGEVNGEKYEICGRPDLDMITVGFLLPRASKVEAIEIEEDEDDEPPTAASDIKILFNSSKEYFLFSPKVEDQLLAAMKDFPRYELMIKSSVCSFGAHTFSTLDQHKQRIWRRFLREIMNPMLKDETRVTLMEDRLNFEVNYTDDALADSDSSSDDAEELSKKKRNKKKKGGKKRASIVPTSESAAVSHHTAGGAGEGAGTGGGMATTGSSRLSSRMSSRKGIGLLAKRNSTRTGPK